jgi:hypothetical protein
MRRSTRRLIRKNTEFAALMLLGPLGGHIHAERWPGEATFTNRVTWPTWGLGPKPVAAWDRKRSKGRR